MVSDYGNWSLLNRFSLPFSKACSCSDIIQNLFFFQNKKSLRTNITCVPWATFRHFVHFEFKSLHRVGKEKARLDGSSQRNINTKNYWK